MSQVSEILCDVELPVQVRSETAFFLLNDVERFRCEDGKFRVIYATYNILNGMKYVGQHTTSNLNDGYLGSGILIQKAISKHGKEVFDYGILNYCKTREELNESEKYWIEYFRLKNQSYNIGRGGTGGDNITNNPRYDEIIVKMCIASSGRFLGNHHSEETKQLQREAKLGKTQSKEHIESRSRSLIGKTKGRVVPQKRRDKIRQTLKNKPLETCEWCGYQNNTRGVMVKLHRENCKQNSNNIKNGKS